MKKNTKIIIIVIALLAIVTAIGATYNRQFAKEKMELLKAAEVTILEDGTEAVRLSMEDMKNLSEEDFTANLKSSAMRSPEEHTYTGIALSELIKKAGVSLEGKSHAVVRSVDGYTVLLKIDEIKEADNIYLTYKDNGDYLGSYEDKDGKGPYMIVIRNDSFSQRWAKYVCEIEVL
ncbi:MAG: molybdopterin-dependent oxidoreductase [Anaerovoracaceae bacterium]|jgi:DMSO/TMAO reductase YedYZ molybdopterin-dependent catalytic subunit